MSKGYGKGACALPKPLVQCQVRLLLNQTQQKIRMLLG